MKTIRSGRKGQVFNGTLPDQLYTVRSAMPTFDDQARFDADLSPHQHLACTECKRVEDFHWEGFDDIQAPLKTEEWGDIRSKHVVLRGICKACLKKKAKKSRQMRMTSRIRGDVS
jgi:hypothetical protein